MRGVQNGLSSVIILTRVVLNILNSDLRFENLRRNHLQSQVKKSSDGCGSRTSLSVRFFNLVCTMSTGPIHLHSVRGVQ